MKTIMQNRKKVNSYFVFLLLLLFCVFQYGVSKIYGFTLFPDEFGYWASAAEKAGYDWSEVAGMGSYYSYGYSLILTPVLMFFKDSIVAYRMAVFVNMLLMCVSLFLLKDTLERIFPGEKGKLSSSEKILFAGIGVFYPGWLFYMQMTLTEALLMFLFVLLTWLLVRLVSEKKVIFAAALAVALIYTYTVHMRTIGILIACALTLFIWAVIDREGRKPAAVFFLMLFAGGVCAALLKQNTISTVFAQADATVLSGNDYGNQWKKLEVIVTLSGMKRLLLEALGKLYYLGMASFGIFYWGMGWSIRKCLQGRKVALAFKKGKGSDATEEREDCQVCLAVFLILSALGEILISAIFMYQSKGIDTLVYGRYTEFILPVFMVVGIYRMVRSKCLFRATLLLGVASGVLTLLVLNVIEREQRAGMRGYMAVGISYVLKEEGFQVYRYLKAVWLFGAGCMLLTAVFLYLGRKGNRVWIFGGILAMEIFLGLQASHHYTYRVNSGNFSDRRMAETIIEEIETAKDPSPRIVYLDEGTPEFIDFLQMQLREEKIEVVNAEVAETQKQNRQAFAEEQNKQKSIEETLETSLRNADFVITYIETNWDGLLQEKFGKRMETNGFLLFYDRKE